MKNPLYDSRNRGVIAQIKAEISGRQQQTSLNALQQF